MRTAFEPSTRASSLFLCALGLGLVTWTGCQKPKSESSESARANEPSSAGPAGDEPKPSGSPTEKDPPKPGSAGTPEPGSPSPSAGESGGARDPAKPENTREQKPGSPSPSAGESGGEAERGMDEPSAGGGAKPKGSGDISDAELKKFVEVTEILRPKREALKKKLQEAKNPAEAKKAQKEVMNATRKAAEEAGLSFERFRAISRRAKANPKLQNRIRELFAAKRGGEASGGK